jgi:hypothetical protein
MLALSREELFEACRAIYKIAGDNFMLPPLIRDVESPEENPKHTYYSLTDTECVRFIIEFDEAYVDDNKFPLKKLPLRFRCELCDLDFQETPVELGEIETRALIRAFFLGVKVHFITNENRLSGNCNLRIQLSSTLFVECGELTDEGDELTTEAICNQVSLDLYSKSCDFFGSPQDGVTVWRIRVAQELFGEPKPAPELFWPSEAELTARRAMMGQALRAAGPAVALAAVAPAQATGSLRASSPFLAVSPIHLATMRRASFASGIAVSAVIAVSGLTLGYAFLSKNSASPRKPTIVAQTASAELSPEKSPALDVPFASGLGLAAQTPVTPVRFGDTSEASDQLPRAAPPLGETPLTVAEAKPAPPQEFTAPPAKPESISTAGTRPRKQSEILQNKKCAAVKTVSSHTGQGKRSVHGGKRSPANPLIVVRRAVNFFAARIAKDLRRIPLRLSSLMAGQ